MSLKFNDWLDLFLSEKDVKKHLYEVSSNGVVHLIEYDFLVEIMKKTTKKEQAIIKDTLVKLDFNNADITHYFQFLSEAYIKNLESVRG